MSERQNALIGRIVHGPSWLAVKDELRMERVRALAAAKDEATLMECARQLQALERVLDELEHVAQSARRAKTVEVV